LNGLIGTKLQVKFLKRIKRKKEMVLFLCIKIILELIVKQTSHESMSIKCKNMMIATFQEYLFLLILNIVVGWYFYNGIIYYLEKKRVEKRKKM